MKRFQVIYAGGLAEVLTADSAIDALATSVEKLQGDDSDLAVLAVVDGKILVRVFELEL